MKIPPEVEKEVAIVDWNLPGREELAIGAKRHSKYGVDDKVIRIARPPPGGNHISDTDCSD